MRIFGENIFIVEAIRILGGFALRSAPSTQIRIVRGENIEHCERTLPRVLVFSKCNSHMTAANVF